jgi:hypothetical protein
VTNRTTSEALREYDLHEIAHPDAPGRRRVTADRWRAALDRDVPGRVALVVALSWLIVPVVWALEPAPANANAVPAWAVVVGSMWQLAVIAALIGLWQRKRVGVALSLAAVTVLLGDVVACPLTGHHAFGGWWVAELGLVLGAFGVSARALNRT